MRQFSHRFTMIIVGIWLTALPPKTAAIPFSSVQLVVPTVSIIQLIANPQKYRGKQIKVIGYYVYDANAHKPPEPLGGLYLSKDLAVCRSYENGVSIAFSKNLILEPNDPTLKEKFFDNKYVAVEGTFTEVLDYLHFRSHLQVSKVQLLKTEPLARIE